MHAINELKCQAKTNKTNDEKTKKKAVAQNQTPEQRAKTTTIV